MYLSISGIDWFCFLNGYKLLLSNVFEECKYIVKEIEVSRNVIEDLEILFVESDKEDYY